MATKKPVKKVTKTVTKSPAKKKTTSSRKKTAELRSFRVYKNAEFMEFKISRQTVYWTILVAFIILMQLWILKSQLEVIQATDDLSNSILQ